MKNSLRGGLFLVAVAALLVAGCFTGHGVRSQGQREPAVDFDATLRSMVNDRSTWVDPVSFY